MIEFLSNISTQFYYGFAAATSFIFIVSILISFVFYTDIEWHEALLLVIFWPITALGLACAGFAILYDYTRNIVCRKKYNIKLYEAENEDSLLCGDDELIINDVSYRDNLKIYKILDEQNIDFIISPAVPWKIFRDAQYVVDNRESRSYKLFFGSVEDKATFQFYWESLKDE